MKTQNVRKSYVVKIPRCADLPPTSSDMLKFFEDEVQVLGVILRTVTLRWFLGTYCIIYFGNSIVLIRVTFPSHYTVLDVQLPK